MSQKDNIFTVKLVKRNGKLVHVIPAMLGQQLDFVDSLEEGQEVNVMFEAHKDDGTNLQLAKIHVEIRKLAQDIGYTFEEMKITIKKNAGLVYNMHSGKQYIKSFADCSKEELASVIQAINQAWETLLPDQNYP